MKPRFYIILSTVALVILLIVQLYNISVTFDTKYEQFNTRYGAVVKQALYEYQNITSDFQPDSVFFLFDFYAEDFIYTIQDALPGEDRDSLNPPVLNIYTQIPDTHC